MFLPGVNNLLGENGKLNAVSETNLRQQAANFTRFVEKVREKKFPQSPEAAKVVSAAA